MPINRNALIRYKTIDRMLRGGRQATLEELIDACSDALQNYSGMANVSRRTIQHDLQEMRYSEALGYYAPIEVRDKKYYTYTRRGYSITNVPLSENDMSHLSEAVELLKQMSSFSAFNKVEDVVNRLEDHIASMRFKTQPVILLENNEKLRGLEFVTPLHDAITSQAAVEITYKSFRSQEPATFCFSPYILKEYRNRWFVFGKRHNDLPEYSENVTNLALDRIESIEPAPKAEQYMRISSFNPKTHFRDMIGVSRNMDSTVEHVVFRAAADEVAYIRTKPLHHSQKEIESHADGSVTFSIDVILNVELDHELLSHGCRITVLSPQILVDRIRENLSLAHGNYQ